MPSASEELTSRMTQTRPAETSGALRRLLPNVRRRHCSLSCVAAVATRRTGAAPSASQAAVQMRMVPLPRRAELMAAEYGPRREAAGVVLRMREVGASACMGWNAWLLVGGAGALIWALGVLCVPSTDERAVRAAWLFLVGVVLVLAASPTSLGRSIRGLFDTKERFDEKADDVLTWCLSPSSSSPS
jgi:hypothetical protein